MICAAHEVKDRPLALRYFGEDMVVYRGASGRVMLVEAYCPHMGTHLAHNNTSYVVQDGAHLEGDSIRCPYHGWRFGPDGQCDDIPYSPGQIPKAACLKTWSVVERAGVIWMWHDEEGGTPEFDLPSFAEWDNPQWVNWVIDDMGELPCHPVEIVDNICDKGHLEPVHGSIAIQQFENVFEGHTARQILRAGHRTLAGSDGHYMTNDTIYIGPGILLSTMAGEYPSVMLFCHTPVDDGRAKLWHGLTVKAPMAEPDRAILELIRGYQTASLKALSQDCEIWGSKRACINPMVVAGDGPFGKVRTWYRQFYAPREQAESFHRRVNGVVVTRGTADAPWQDAAE